MKNHGRKKQQYIVAPTPVAASKIFSCKYTSGRSGANQISRARQKHELHHARKPDFHRKSIRQWKIIIEKLVIHNNESGLRKITCRSLRSWRGYSTSQCLLAAGKRQSLKTACCSPIVAYAYAKILHSMRILCYQISGPQVEKWHQDRKTDRNDNDSNILIRWNGDFCDIKRLL